MINIRFEIWFKLSVIINVFYFSIFEVEIRWFIKFKVNLDSLWKVYFKKEKIK